MNRGIIPAILMATLSISSTFAIEPWENPQVNRINRLPSGNCSVPYKNSEQLKSDLTYPNILEESKSEYVKTLNGDWFFNYSPSVEKTPKDFQQSEFDFSNWDSIEVPLSWQAAGYGILSYVNYGFEIPKI